MSHRSRIILFFLICNSLCLWSQEPIKLSECIEKAMKHHPQGLQVSELEKLNLLNEKVISSGWLPQLSINGQISWQSEVMQLDIPIPGIEIPSPDKDQYRITLDVQQMIYDGGINHARQQLRETNYQADHQEAIVALYPVNEQVSRFYFQKILLDKNLEILNLNKSEIENALQIAEAAVKNGAKLPSEALILKAEVLKIQQSANDLESSIETTLEILNILTGEDLKGFVFSIPEYKDFSDQPLQRPELKLFDLQKEKIINASLINKASTLPRLSAFAQAGYGKPTLNPISDTFDFYYMFGIRLAWNIWDWNKYSNEKQSAVIQSNIHQMRKEAFEQNIEISKLNTKNRIQQLEQLLQTDNDIIALQELILESSTSQYKNGVITSTEYLARLNALNLARLQLQTHQVQKLQAINEYQIITGTFNPQP